MPPTLSNPGPEIPNPESRSGFRPGEWLTNRGWWFLPGLLAVSLALPWVFGQRWYADTAYYQAIATQMAREGTWLRPMQGDLPYFNKPPLAFWIHGGLVKAFGDGDLVTHAPEAVFYVLTCLCVAWLGRRLHGSLTGVLAGCAMALTDDWIWRIANFKLDFLHTLLLLAAIACWVQAFLPCPENRRMVDAAPRSRKSVSWCILAGMCIGGALMTKPLMGLGLPLLALAWLWLAGLLNGRSIRLLSLSLLVAIVMALPWHLSMVADYGARFPRAYFVEQSVMRATGEMFEARPWYWYFGHAAAGDPDAAPPWTMWPIYALSLAGLGVVAARWRNANLRPGDVLAATWTIVWIAALSAFAGKRNYYVLVVHPGTAWLAGIAIAALITRMGAAWRRSATDACVRGTALVAVSACFLLLARAPHEIRKAQESLPVPERDQFMAFLRENRRDIIYNCGLPYRMASLTYIQAGIWPRSLREREPMPPELVPTGGWMVYRDDMLLRHEFESHMDPKDRVVFRSSPKGNYMVMERK